ncbi:conserved hypothetical protein [Pediculus humanus corporis]|uniref:Uncharacterized protein n=1 Tax=Pediculus humanus subsp. corporis TaxID=121224 RepID=E0VKK7_PEDHC|nr:uncharacterized protein Phum_PHUM266760 [Pediculus humanus corporis]EEB13913.1 conserved hypothetical protein [Pediculus humanus corporis]
MSSFLMNPSSAYTHHSVVVDPKFPPTEEYSQNNYISSPVTGPDYFGNHQQYGVSGYGGYEPPNTQQAPPTVQTGGMQGLIPIPQQPNVIKNEIQLLQSKNDVEKCEMSAYNNSAQYNNVKSDTSSNNIQTEVSLNHSLPNVKVDVQSAESPTLRRNNEDDTRSSPVGRHITQEPLSRNSPSRKNSPLQRHAMRGWDEEEESGERGVVVKLFRPRHDSFKN